MTDDTSDETRAARRHQTGEEPTPVAATEPDAHAETDRLERLDDNLTQARDAADEVTPGGQ